VLYYAVCKCLGEKGLPDTAKNRKKRSALVYLALYLTHDNPAQMVFFGFKKKNARTTAIVTVGL
jgi:hypothetical protein